MAHQSLERKLSYYNDPEYAAVRHAQSGRLFNWVKVSHGFKKFRLRRWNSTGSWVIIVLDRICLNFRKTQCFNNSTFFRVSTEPRTVRDNRSHQLSRGRGQLHQAEERVQADDGVLPSPAVAASPATAPTGFGSDQCPIAPASGSAPYAVGRFGLIRVGVFLRRILFGVQRLREGTAAAGRLSQ